MNISKLINAGDINESIIRIDENISKLCEFGKNIESLSDPQKIFYYIQSCKKEIYSGGFKQFYGSSSGDYAAETCYSLKIIGAVKLAKIVMSANDQFPLKAVPKDRSERQKIVGQIPEKSIEVWKELDRLFTDSEENLNVLNLEFVRKNKNFF